MQILIALNNYDDLFSDFDIRSYAERPFSRDFLDELNLRMIKAAPQEEKEVVMLVPPSERDVASETIIIKRLEKFFHDRNAFYIKKNKNAVIKSFAFILTGLFLMFVANFFTHMIPPAFSDFLLIPSWYFVWSGLEQFVDKRSDIKDKIQYYGVLVQVTLKFDTRIDAPAH